MKFPAGLRGAAAFKLTPAPLSVRFIILFYNSLNVNQTCLYDNSSVVKCFWRCAREQKERKAFFFQERVFNREINFHFVTFLSFHCV